MITWLIDMGYVTKASKGRLRLDYVKARTLIESKLKAPCSAIVFNSVSKAYGIETGLTQFYYSIKQAGFTVNLYPMEGGGQKQVDVAIASHAVWRAAKGDDIVLSSGDLDFLPAVQIVTEQAARKLYLFTFNFGVHDELSEAASEHWYFEDSPEIER